MKGKPLSRWVYLFFLVALVAIALAVAHFHPVLHTGAVNTLGFIGFWLTLYGLIVAIFEIARTGSVTHQMAHVAEASHNRLKRQMQHHEIQACLEIINAAVNDLNSKKAVPVIFIARIKQGYISSFSTHGTPERYKENLDILNSYEHVIQSRPRKAQANPNYAASQSSEVGVEATNSSYRMTIDTLKRMQDDLLTHSAAKHEYIGDPI